MATAAAATDTKRRARPRGQRPAPAGSKLWTPDLADPTEDVVAKVLAAAGPMSPVSPAPIGA